MFKVETITRTCVCGKRAVKDYHDIVDEVYEKEGDTIRIYEGLCEECYRRIKELDKRFDFVGGIWYGVEYIREKDLFVIRARNEYGDSAVLVENWKHTRKTLRSLWTREIVFVEGDRITGVL